jgi:biotin carboxyl carrier protein
VPSFDIIIQGKSYRVEIPNPGAVPLQVIVDGQPFDVTIAGTEINAAPAARLAQPPPPAPQPTPLPPLPQAAAPRPAAPAVSGGHQINAPMPGTILTVDITVGQAVESGQVVCVLEAMKMKNPIRAHAAGTVTEIAVQAGQTVAYGDLLIRLT